ncbi:serine hydrolase [Nocardia neocaledoniensis NBRC 108232]|uniref:D-alanyl-D-alanine carboxypeptidase n=1 Tax=Nocardia neocaledoniensis TaxID=236511 RepID=A0A317P560_9NOCA|nr:serine hydrolase domain-containing protein [Nocardia neocaledoniensis]PWV81524.1 D-alanyl-D-alanine carboxypeptidase [Nocardia neocaledoniensis]GEM32152.1 serine hydrolase [Nocardia neocaledoniensis NBRC 108232]
MNPFRRNSGRAVLAVVVTGAVLAVAACGETSVDAVTEAKTPPPAVATAMDTVVGQGFPGVQVVIDGPAGHRTFTAGVGDLGTRAPFPDDARVRIGSNTKTYVATVIMQLVAEGEIDLDAPIERYLPGVVRGNGNDGNRITVRQMLQHTSGVPDYVGSGADITTQSSEQLDPDDEALRWQHFEMADLVRRAMTMPPQFEPGAKSVYTNTNYLLAGLLIERVTGNAAADEIGRRILEPLGLRDTYVPAARETGIRGPHARGYHQIDGAPVDFTDFDPSWAATAGDMVATATDLNRFFTALLSGELLPPAQLAEMQRTVPFDRMPGAGYGLALIERTTSCGTQVWGHGGSIVGFATRNAVTAEGTAVTVTVNQLPSTEAQADAVDKLLDAALCAS